MFARGQFCPRQWAGIRVCLKVSDLKEVIMSSAIPRAPFARHARFEGVFLRPVVTGNDSTRLASVEALIVPDHAIDQHIHDASGEHFFFIDGAGELYDGTAWQPVAGGDAITVKAGTSHAARCRRHANALPSRCSNRRQHRVTITGPPGAPVSRGSPVRGGRHAALFRQCAICVPKMDAIWIGGDVVKGAVSIMRAGVSWSIL